LSLNFPGIAITEAFAKPLSDKHVTEGDSTTLDCELFNPQQDVIWLKDGKQVYPGGKFTINRQGSSHQLTIHHPIKSDEAVYSCALKHNPVRRSSSTVSVDTSTQVKPYGYNSFTN